MTLTSAAPRLMGDLELSTLRPARGREGWPGTSDSGLAQGGNNSQVSALHWPLMAVQCKQHHESGTGWWGRALWQLGHMNMHRVNVPLWGSDWNSLMFHSFVCSVNLPLTMRWCSLKKKKKSLFLQWGDMFLASQTACQYRFEFSFSSYRAWTGKSTKKLSKWQFLASILMSTVLNELKSLKWM